MAALKSSAAQLLLLLALLLACAASASDDSVLPPRTQDELDAFAETTVIDARLLEDSSQTNWEEIAAAAAGRTLLQDDAARWRAQGRYVLIRNPQMPGGRSSTGVVAIHAALLPASYKIVLAGRNLPPAQFGAASIPEPKVGGNVSTVYDVKTGTYVVTPNFETLFCTAHSHMSDGVIVAAGGDMGYLSASYHFPWMKEGRDVVRLFDPKTLTWTTLPGVKLSEYRWYPTQVNLPDDRVVIVSGFLDDPFRPATAKPAPSIDVFDYRTKKVTVSRSKYDLGKKFFTNITPGYQLYPTVFLLPWTDSSRPDDYFLLFYTCRTGQVVRFTSDSQFVPMWMTPGLPVPNMCAAFSAMGSAVILPLRPEKQYAFEFAMFGGGTQGKGLDCRGICNEPASDKIFRLRLPSIDDALAGKWPKYWNFAGKDQWETMGAPRVFADAVLLPNGKVAVLNGAKRGVPGGAIDGGASARDANYQAILYDPEAPAGQRVTPLAASQIHRYYHSNALLLPSGDIWVAGSEQADCVQGCPKERSPPDQEYRAELLQLPYAFLPRPTITAVDNRYPRYGGKVTLQYKQGGSKPVTAASIIPPGANTHSLNMMQRVVFLRVVSSAPGTITVQMPEWRDRVANPGYYMLWLLEGDVPSKEAAWIKLAA